MYTFRVSTALLSLLFLVGCQTTSGYIASNPVSSAVNVGQMPVGQQVVPPFGYLVFCKQSPANCEQPREVAAQVQPIAANPPQEEAPLATASLGATKPAYRSDGGIALPRAKPANLGDVATTQRLTLQLPASAARLEMRPEASVLPQTSAHPDLGVQRVNAIVPPILQQTMALTSARWHELTAINTRVNDQVRPVRDEVLYQRSEWWAYPTNNAGDCEDYALMKRKLLLAKGWPASALLLATANQWNGEGHAVLVVVTDRGDFVLDNQTGTIVGWQDAPYKWISRQSQEDPNKWVNLDPSRMRTPGPVEQVANIDGVEGRT